MGNDLHASSYITPAVLTQMQPFPAIKARQSCTFFHISPLMLSLSSVLLAALTFLSWPSGPRPWLRLLTTSPTELQIGWHTMPQILIQRHNAPTSRTPSTRLLSILSFISDHISFPPALSGSTPSRYASGPETSPTLLECGAA